jgi:secondary thiamine-phosphate synthase enzyme
MKSYTQYLTFSTKEKIEFINITERVEKIVSESKIKEGLCLVNAMHITASVFINDEEGGLKKDFKAWLEKISPKKAEYFHNLTGEDNGHAHLKRTIMGREVIVAVTNGRLDFGPWEQIFYGEFDGKRPKRVIVKVIGGVVPFYICFCRLLYARCYNNC